MEDRILKLLNEKNMILAKEAILDHENKTKEEKNEYTRCRMIDRLNLYKQIYSEQVDINVDSIKERPSDNIYFSKCTPSSSKLELSDKQVNLIFESSFNFSFLENGNETKKQHGLIFNEVSIVDSSEVVIGYFEAEQSVYINRVINSTIVCKGKQIRLLDSHNILLYVDVSCGITLEKCSNIKIYGLESPNNNYKEVRDFSSPFKIQNYEIMSDKPF